MPLFNLAFLRSSIYSCWVACMRFVLFQEHVRTRLVADCTAAATLVLLPHTHRLPAHAHYGRLHSARTRIHTFF